MLFVPLVVWENGERKCHVVQNNAAAESSCCDLSLLSWLQFRAKMLFIVCLGPVTFLKLHASPLIFNSQLIIPLIQHLRINVYLFTVLNSELVVLSSPQEGNENILLNCCIDSQSKTRLSLRPRNQLVWCFVCLVSLDKQGSDP